MSLKRVHFIAIGGSVMHQLALALHRKGYTVSGSDDEIYDPARTNLEQEGLLPEESGWHSEKITGDIDWIVLGMHAREDNPELAKAEDMGLEIYSFPELIAEISRDKKRVVIGGSHGKTTTTSMIMHCLRMKEVDFDYLVGARVEGFDQMVRLTDAPLIILEGDEYLSSPRDDRPKFCHYKPHIAVLTGMAWDHMNVFPDRDAYAEAFDRFLSGLEDDAILFYDSTDNWLSETVEEHSGEFQYRGYRAFGYEIKGDEMILTGRKPGQKVHVPFYGAYNAKNARAAQLVCRELGVEEQEFLDAMASFYGADRRQQLLAEGNGIKVILDFAHAPSKVRAATTAFAIRFDEKPWVAVAELHTYSSLNKDFLPQYQGALNDAPEAAVFYSPHTFEMKRLEPYDPEDVRKGFGRDDLHVFRSRQALQRYLATTAEKGWSLVMMTSGRMEGLASKQFAEQYIENATDNIYT